MLDPHYDFIYYRHATVQQRESRFGVVKESAVLVAAHHPYWMPSAPLYLPLQVGAYDKPDFGSEWTRDDSGDNISAKNATFCELTGLYWAWKNLDADVYGLCHYRRYLGYRRFGQNKKFCLLTESQIDKLLADHDMILPRKRHYWIETRESQYAHAHHAEDLRCVEQILSERYPEYLDSWHWMLNTRSGHICNMFVMRKADFDAYCTWLFDILFEAENRLDISSYSPKDQRVFGYLGERLLDVWIRQNRKTFAEVPVINMESQNWPKKVMVFLKRKIRGQE